MLNLLSFCKANGSKMITSAPLAIVVMADPLKSEVWIEDASVASTLIQLQAEDLGLGSCWVQIRCRFTNVMYELKININLFTDGADYSVEFNVNVFFHRSKRR